MEIPSFISDGSTNLHHATVESFGDEWQKFSEFSDEDLNTASNEYFDLLDEQILNSNSTVLDLGCGSGRWSYVLAGKVKHIEAVDPSNSVLTAAKLLSSKSNVRVVKASANDLPYSNETFDLMICLGVLHHIPDTEKALSAALTKLKHGGHALLYFYYNLENRGFLYKLLFGIVDLKRRVISSMPSGVKKWMCDLIAYLIYVPVVMIVRFVKTFDRKNRMWHKLPLSYYHNKSVYIMRNDALDRFGTVLEKRFSKQQITEMLEACGMHHIRFSPNQPYWHVIATKK